jgi:TolB-like protein/Tfp pilus assembly protein PilF
MLPERIGHYRVTGKLGEGGMGEIYSARDEKLNRPVALKLISAALLDDPHARSRFLREARAAAALQHPFICTIHEVLEVPHQTIGQPVIVMECVEGETLFDRIARGPLAVPDICRFTTEIAEALGAAHARGVIHRDIKSGNIMLTAAGHVKVMDFGLALITAASADEETVRLSEERTNTVAGTLPYIAPELLRGAEASAASDLYALGVVMYEMAAARRPFAAKTQAVLFSEILNREPTPARQLNNAIPAALDDLIARLLTKDPAQRPTSQEVIDGLRAAPEPLPKTQRALAVLPFRSLTGDPASAHLGVALADATTSELALVRSLLVRPTATILRYDDCDPVEAGRDLGVDAVVAGTFQRAGSRLRVSVQLIDVAEARPLWSTKVDTTLDDVFAMQDEVSRKIVDALQLELTPADERRFAKRIHASGDVLELCLKGRVALLHDTVADLNAAIAFFESARAIDPQNPLPWIGLSDAYSRFAFTYDPDAGWDERAKEMCDRALELDPDLPEARYIRGRLAWTPQAGFQHELAIREFAAALAERPNLNEGFDRLGVVLFHVGLIDEARELFQRALAISPDDPSAPRMLGTMDAFRGDYAACIARTTQAKSGESWGLVITAYSQIRLGDLQTAAETIEQGSRLFPSLALFDGLRAQVAALRGDAAGAQRAIDRASLNRRAFGHFHHVEFDIAGALATLGRTEEALTWLRSGVRNGFPCLAAVEGDPLFASLHSSPDFQALLVDLRAVRDHHRGVLGEGRGVGT